MSRKSLGYTELQWTCPNCGGINPGPEETCHNCGSPQPEDVQFEQARHEELITDEQKIARAKAGADIHCAYCGTRNPAGAEFCSQCNADLSEGARRQAGRVVGAFDFSAGPVAEINCPHCGAANPETALDCRECGGSLAQQKPPEPVPAARPQPAAPARPSRLVPILVGVAILLVCGIIAVIALLSSRTEAITGVVRDVTWERTIPIMELVPVQYQTWQDEIPAEGVVTGCEEEVRYVQAEPAPNSLEVCGTPYSVDTGSGFAEVVQDCEYHVYDNFCDYSVEEWRQVDLASLTGRDFSPEWPAPVLEAGQRLGQESFETYACIFDTAERTYTYETTDVNIFQQCQIGSEWNLNVNTFGNVVSIER